MTVQPSTRSDSRSRSPVTLRACAVPCTFQMVTPWLRNFSFCRFIYTGIEIKNQARKAILIKYPRMQVRPMQLPSNDPVATTLQRLRNRALAVCRIIATKLLIMKRWSGTKTNHSDTRGPGSRNFQKVILRESRKGCLFLKSRKPN